MSYKPYPAYKDSGVEWLGEIPEGWEIRKLKYLTFPSDERNGKNPHGDMLSVSGYRGIEIKEYEFEEQIRDDEDLETYRIVHKGQLVVNTMWLNYAGLGISNFEGHVSPAYKAFYVLDSVDKWFLHHFLRCTACVEGYKKYLRGIRPNSLQMPSEDFGAFPVLLPPLPTQKAIAAFLDASTARIDGLVQDYEELVALLKEKRQALVSHAVTRGLSELVSPDDPDFGQWAQPVVFKDSGVEWLGEIPEGWELKRLKWSTTSVKNGVWGDEAKGDDHDLACIRVADFDRRNQSVDESNLTFRNVDPSDLQGRLLEKGDLLIEKSGGGENWPVGYVVQFNHSFPAVTSNFIARVSLSTYANSSFFKYFHLLLYSARVTTRSINQTSGIQNLDSTSYFNNLAVFPPLLTQKAIAAFLDRETAKLDALVAEAESAIELLQERRSALITAAVTGKINVEEIENTK